MPLITSQTSWSSAKTSSSMFSSDSTLMSLSMAGLHMCLQRENCDAKWAEKRRRAGEIKLKLSYAERFPFLSGSLLSLSTAWLHTSTKRIIWIKGRRKGEERKLQQATVTQNIWVSTVPCEGWGKNGPRLEVKYFFANQLMPATTLSFHLPIRECSWLLMYISLMQRTEKYV